MPEQVCLMFISYDIIRYDIIRYDMILYVLISDDIIYIYI